MPPVSTDNYYHGGIPTFLRWRNLSAADFSPFYDLTSPVYSDFTTYIRQLLGHVSPYMNVSLLSSLSVSHLFAIPLPDLKSRALRLDREACADGRSLPQLTLATDPTILAFETGNELGGWTGSAYPPPVKWTTAISELLKDLAPDALVISGSYGVRADELSLDTVTCSSFPFPSSIGVAF
jgi:hypothetical protein